jgi:mandelamide amidase
VIKDNISTVGFPTTAGTAILKGLFPQSDAPVVDALFKSGAILLGKTNMDELSRGFTSANPTFGFARNPYDISRVPGGGSGGLEMRSRPASLQLAWVATLPAQCVSQRPTAESPVFDRHREDTDAILGPLVPGWLRLGIRA